MSKILVIGDSCIDEYVYCTTDRFCPDAPVPVLKPKSYVTTKGMAGNVVDNLKSLDVKVDLISNTNEIKKTRYVDSRTNHMFMRIDKGEDDISPIAKKTLESIKWSDYDAVIISDYCKGFIDTNTIEYISNQHGLTFLDTKKEIGHWAEGITFIKINEVELNSSLEFLQSEEDIYAPKIVATLGSKGAQYSGIIFPVDEVDVRDTSGAGDTFMAGLVYAYLTHSYPDNTTRITESIKFANHCSTQIVQKKGTAKITKNQIL